MPQFSFPPPGRQVFIQAFLNGYRTMGLHEALRKAVGNIPTRTLHDEILVVVPEAGMQIIQGKGVRDEEVFATPTLLRQHPGLLAYYRLLLGISQKVFYTTRSGLNIFHSMEERQFVGPQVTDDVLVDLCVEINQAITNLLIALPTNTLAQDIAQLPLMTLGAQTDGAWRGQIGQRATAKVFESMSYLIADNRRTTNMVTTASSVTVENSAGRLVTLALAPDPDVVIRETVNGQSVYKAAIVIKGGLDYSNLQPGRRSREVSSEGPSGWGAGLLDHHLTRPSRPGPTQTGIANHPAMARPDRSHRDVWTIMGTTGGADAGSHGNLGAC